MIKRILIVDDEDCIRELLIEILSAAVYEVLAAAEGKEALNILEHNKFDLIITDIIMPDMEGIEFINKVKRQKKLSAKIIAISGSGNVRVNSYLNLALKMGADSVLEKPFTIEQILEAVRKLL